jgi:hypothetical protein
MALSIDLGASEGTNFFNDPNATVTKRWSVDEPILSPADALEVFAGDKMTIQVLGQGKMRAKLSLKDSAGNVVKAVTNGDDGNAGGNVSFELYPVADGADGDNNSSNENAKWNIDVASFGTCKIELDCKGSSESGGAEEKVQLIIRNDAFLPEESYVQTYSGAGSIVLEIPFSVTP